MIFYQRITILRNFVSRANIAHKSRSEFQRRSCNCDLQTTPNILRDQLSSSHSSTSGNQFPHFLHSGRNWGETQLWCDGYSLALCQLDNFHRLHSDDIDNISQVVLVYSFQHCFILHLNGFGSSFC